ncbi:hypothetical protein RvY_13336-1 [Ramazzottius varieornatus]|uniref:Cytochrome P450 n=1 Tax=Ramazzottius varieornatus TaxID=947166 RepID=A0A1D1VPP0_RAMVA|nr:hypothetical protein RvY_13336-1 [Ramazzottius varieornatus]
MGKSWLQDMILDEARELVDDLTALKENPIDPTEVITPCANNVICGIAYGKRFSHQDARLRRLTELIGKNLTLTAKGQPVDFYPFLRHIPFTKFSTVLKECTKNNEEIARFLQDLVDEHRKVFRPSADAPSDYIDAFLKQQYTQRDDPTSTFTDRQLIMSIHNLFAAGTETTSTSLCWAILYLIENPKVLANVQKEIDSVLGDRQFPVLEDKEKLPYCQATITEVLRLGNLVPVAGRKTVEDVELSGFIVPKDTKIAPMIFSVHEDPVLFPEPMKFKPERFLDADGKFISKVEWLMPFGSGKRQCLGESLARMELFLFFVTLARNFTLGPLLGGAETPGHTLMRIVNAPKPFRTSFIYRS